MMIHRRFLIALTFAGLVAIPLFAQEVKPAVNDAASRLRWHEEFIEMRERSPFKEMKWSHIGPQLMSGRVTDIAKPPRGSGRVETGLTVITSAIS